MITFNNNIIGMFDVVYKDIKQQVQIRQGNCDGVCITTTEDGMTHLYSFFGDNKHMENMIKSNYDLFNGCENIKLNIADKGAERIMKYATKMGHHVEVFYQKIGESE